MSNVVSWKTATQIIDILKEENAMVSGMSVEEAASALGYVKTASGIYVKSAVTTTVESVTGATATAVADAATTTASTGAANLALYETSSGTAAVAGIGSVALPIASMIVASAGGYLIGNEIYKQNSDFLDKLMFPVYDFITGNHVASTLNDSSTVPFLFDADGKSYMPSSLVSGVKSYLDNLPGVPAGKPSALLAKYGINETKYDNFPTVYITLDTGGAPIYYINVEYSIDPAVPTEVRYESMGVKYLYMMFSGNCDLQLYRSDNAGASPYYPNGTSSGFTNGDRLAGNVPINDPFMPTYLASYGAGCRYQWLYASSPIVVDGSVVYSGLASGLPTGVSKYTPGATTSLKASNGTMWDQVALPNTSPLEMPEPVETPDPSPTPEKITPYINPVQPQPASVPIILPSITPGLIPILPLLNPEPDIDTSPDPQPDPARDPSQETTPSTDPDPASSTATIPDPVNTGSTPVPVVPTIPALPSASGLLHVYNPTNEQLNQFGAWLWTTFSGDLIDTLSKLFNNPMDAVIGLHELYSTPTTGETGTIRAGYLDSQVASRLVSSRYTEIKCGAISIPEYWGNYLDYSPYTKTYVYLPFIGIVELNADDIIGHGVEITYHIDAYNGSCIALITTAKSGSPETMTYQYSGNCAVELPITSGMKSAMQSALIGAATLAIGASTGGAGGLVAASALGAIKGGASSKNTVQHSGSFGSSYGAMGIKKPYMIVKRPVQKVVYGYNETYGYPSHKKVLISSCTGYLKAIEVDVVSSTATEEEKKMIEMQLKSGIFIS